MLRSKHVNSYSLLPMAFSKKATPLLRLKMSDSSESKKDRCIHCPQKGGKFYPILLHKFITHRTGKIYLLFPDGLYIDDKIVPSGCLACCESLIILCILFFALNPMGHKR